MATSESETKKSRDRSPSFPIITLEHALRRAQEFYDQEKRGSAPFSVAAEHWQYSPSSSGALQTISAMKQYGLMVEEGGSGMDRKVRLTELALRIILDARPDSTERAQFKMQAARSPAIVEDVYKRWPEGLPSEQNLNHYLVLERQFNAQTANKAVKILKSNEMFTGEFANAMLSELSQMETDTMSNSALPARFGRDQNQVSDAQIISARPGVMIGRIERFIGPNSNDIEIRFQGEPTADHYEALKKFVEFRLQLLKPSGSDSK